jgi:predicted O-linked N-acetylglucosamine transferase (SPINDLY family)
MTTLAETLAYAAQQHQAGNLALAETLYRQVLQANPADANALHLLGVLAYQGGYYQEAVDLMVQALAVEPEAGEFYCNLGGAYLALNQLQQARTCYQQALRLRPEFPESHNNLGNVLAREGKLPEAVACYREALRLRANFPEALNNLGNALARQGQYDEAITAYRQALAVRPNYPEAHNNLGLLLAQEGEPAKAMLCYRTALSLSPDFPEAHNNLGNALAQERHWDEALAAYEQALSLRPDYPECHHSVGLVQESLGKPDEALAAYEQAVRLKPDFAGALNSLGMAYKDQGRLDEAIACFRRAARASPQLLFVHSNLIYALHYAASYDPEAVFAEHLRFAARFAEPAPSAPADRHPDRRLRIGYVSPDFRENVMGRYSEAVIAAHDRSQFEVFCYANVHVPDNLTGRIQAVADHWISLIGITDDEAADLIRADRIDILVDQSGHVGGNRLGIFARKPAPIQVTHFSYCDTTGLRTVDYRLTDAHCDPPGQTERFHTETLVRLPEVQWCYPRPAGPEVGPPAAQKAGYITLGCFNNVCKVTEEMMALWVRILTELPGSRLRMQTGTGKAADQRVFECFHRHGIGAERLTLVGRMPREAYFRLYHDVDLCLDTFPFTGCNTTADAVWMGVPVVTLAGPTCTSRQGIAVLTLAGLEDLVTRTPEEYVATAVRLARDAPRLRELRGQLRGRLERSLLLDTARFTRNLEAAYRIMWKRLSATPELAEPARR